MSSIRDRLQEDWKNALKAKDKFTANVISTAKSAILLVQKEDPSKEVTDEDVINILAREVKQRRESLVEFEKGGRQDLIDQCKAEIEIMLRYLPQQLDEVEIKSIVKESAEQVGANSIKDMGKVMAVVRPKTVGRADGKLVSQIVKNYLNEISK